MEHRNTNIDDLGGGKLSHSLGVNPFRVPQNFFVQQNEEIINQIQLEKKDLVDPSNLLKVPEGYFDGLENSVLNKIREAKLKEQLTSKEDGFKVPSDYFEQSNSSILDKIRESKLKEIVTDPGFEVQDSYFSSLTESITTKILEQKLKDHSKNDGFSVPNNYFEDLENKIKSNTTKLHERRETPIISLTERKRNWPKYSAAAVILLISIGSYFSIVDNNKPKEQEVATTITLQEVSDEELVNYLAQVSNTDELMQLSEIVLEKEEEAPKRIDTDINKEDIEEYLNYML